jgi:hypothetical protein
MAIEGRLSLPSHQPVRPRDPTFTAVFSLVAVATACAVVLVTMPRAVEPSQLPALVLDETAAEGALDYDRHAASRAPHNAELDELYNLYLSEGRAEREGQQGLSGTAKRRARIAVITRRLFPALGKEKVVALRARATERFMVALSGQLEVEAEADGLVGHFPDILRKYGLLRADGSFAAPELSVRTMYKARWNMIHERPLNEYLEPMEIQAYEGWTALHAPFLPMEQRAQSAKRFYEAKGHRAAQAHATFLYHGKLRSEAERVLAEEYERTHELRLRNQLLAVRAGL